jgi:hypothetical protein
MLGGNNIQTPLRISHFVCRITINELYHAASEIQSLGLSLPWLGARWVAPPRRGRRSRGFARTPARRAPTTVGARRSTSGSTRPGR